MKPSRSSGWPSTSGVVGAAARLTCGVRLFGEVPPWPFAPSIPPGYGHSNATGACGRPCDRPLKRLFVLTFETEVFGSHVVPPDRGHHPPSNPAEVFEATVRSYALGVAEFLDPLRQTQQPGQLDRECW